jgi:manganese/zinc/iron transport system permease protein
MDGELPTIAEIIETLTLRAGFNTNLVILGTTLLGFSSAIIGVFALLRKRALMTDALSHATLPGIALAFLIAQELGFQGRSIPVLLVGATISGVVGILCIQLLLRHTRLREDASIGIVLSVFFGAGIVALSYVQANAADGSAGLNAFIYGQAATMRASDVYLMGSIALLAVLATLLLIKEFSLVCFNDTFARVDGWPVGVVDLLMMALVVIVTVAGLQAVGLILVVAMLIIPPVSARFWTERVWKLVLIAGILGAMSGYVGSVISALLPGKPAGSVIVLTSGAFFVLSMLLAPSRGVIASSVRALRLRLRIAGDHALELSHDLNATTIPRDAFRELAHLRGWTPPFRWALLRSLVHDGSLVRVTDEGLVLSVDGVERGHRVARNHLLWEQYLVSYADVAPSHVDWSVDQVEHVLSERLVARLEQELTKQGVEIPPAPPPIGGAK